MASTGHSGSHKVQSMHSSGSMTRKLGPSWKQSTGHTSTQSVYLHLMHASVTTNAIEQSFWNQAGFSGALFCPTQAACALSLETPRHPRHVVTLDARFPVFHEAPQREFGAWKRQVVPGNVFFID